MISIRSSAIGFASTFGNVTRAPSARLARDSRRKRRLDLGADGLGKDAGRLHACARRPRAPRELPERSRDQTLSSTSRRSKRSPTTFARISRSRSRRFSARARCRNVPLMPIRTAVRTGDTTPAQRARMLREPPHVLVTTPESLFILLTAENARVGSSAGVTTVIVDEIHAMAADKRGSHLALDAGATRRSGAPRKRTAAAAHRAFCDGSSPRRGRALLESPRGDRERRASPGDVALGRACPATSSVPSPARRCGARSTTGSPIRFARIVRR